jgi:glycosidase
VKDYYNVNPDLVNPANRLQEFEALIARTHRGIKSNYRYRSNHIAQI